MKTKTSTNVPVAPVALQPEIAPTDPPAPTPAPAARKPKTPQKRLKKRPEIAPTAPRPKIDAFGSRIGSRMSNLGVLLIAAGARGITIPEAAEKSGESRAVVSAQYSYWHARGKIRRVEEAVEGQKGKRFRYIADIVYSAQ